MPTIGQHRQMSDARHEAKHREQYRRYGWLGFMTRYLWWSLTCGYDGNPLELEADEARYHESNLP